MKLNLSHKASLAETGACQITIPQCSLYQRKQTGCQKPEPSCRVVQFPTQLSRTGPTCCVELILKLTSCILTAVRLAQDPHMSMLAPSVSPEHVA